MQLGLGDVRAAAWRGPPECAWLDLRHLPSGGLLDAVIAPAHRATITFAGQAAPVVRNRVLVIAAGGGSAAAGGGADRVSDGEQVPEFGAGLVAGGLPGVLAWVSLEPLERQAGQPSGSLARPGAGGGSRGQAWATARPSGRVSVTCQAAVPAAVIMSARSRAV